MRSKGAAKLVAWREGLGLNQSKAAEKLGVGQGTLSEWEAGKKKPDVDNANRIARVSRGAVPVALWSQDEDTTKPSAA